MSEIGGNHEGSIEFEFNGEVYYSVDLDDMTLGEQSVMKRLTGGMTTRQWAEGLSELDPDVYIALFYVSVQRVDPTVTVEQVMAIPLMPQLKRTSASEVATDPPADDGSPLPVEPMTLPTDGGEPRISGLLRSEPLSVSAPRISET